jgi:cardiolipin hydrolase
MEDIIAQLKASIADETLTKSEKKSIKSLMAEQSFDHDQLNFLRSKIYELANEKITDTNYRSIVEWIKVANSAFIARPVESKSEAFFSPGETCREAIIRQINGAVRELKICVFTISDDNISEAIAFAHRKGVDVKIVTDNDKLFDSGSDIGRLAAAGINIKVDLTADHMHHKFMVTDQLSLITGSYNWTRSAANFNHENIILTKESTLIKSFLKEFDRLWEQMKAY